MSIEKVLEEIEKTKSRKRKADLWRYYKRLRRENGKS